MDITQFVHELPTLFSEIHQTIGRPYIITWSGIDESALKFALINHKNVELVGTHVRKGMHSYEDESDDVEQIIQAAMKHTVTKKTTEI
jgi:hypothetical protein